jgi:uncharacterized protein YndB with AHSA1/START domain
MVKDLLVTRSILLNVTPERVWQALTHPGMTKYYMYGREVSSDWKEGSTITWSSSEHGQHVTQKGEILKIVPGTFLKYSFHDPQTGLEDNIETYMHITYEVIPRKNYTELLVTVDHFGGDDARAESAAEMLDFEVLPKLKSLLETTL